MACDPPTSGAVRVTPTTSCPTDWMVCAVGTASSTSRERTCAFMFDWTSTTGEAPDTVTASSMAPTDMLALTVAVKFEGRSRPSRLNVWKPLSVKVTVYVPGRRSTILYCPWLSLTTERVFSMRAGLAASTVTPGRTAPELSFTTPAIALWACATPGSPTSAASANSAAAILFRVIPLLLMERD